MKAVQDLIDQISVFLEKCRHQSFSSTKIIVQKDELEDMLNELKANLPEELERARKIIKNENKILANARMRSDKILSESMEEAKRRVENSEIVKAAQVRGDEIRAQARQEAAQTIREADQEAEQVRMSALNYTKQQISEVRNFLQATLDAEQENYRNLTDTLDQEIKTLDGNLSSVDDSVNLLQDQNTADESDEADDGFDTEDETVDASYDTDDEQEEENDSYQDDDTDEAEDDDYDYDDDYDDDDL